MKNHYLIRPQHLNHAGHLFGGTLLSWIDETGFLVASMKYPGASFVTKALEATEFKAPAENGDVVLIEGEHLTTGESSCRIKVRATNLTTQKPMFETTIVMVNVIDNHKAPIPDK